MIDFGFGEVRLGPLDRLYIERVRTWRNDPAIWTWCRQHDIISDEAQERWFGAQSIDPSIRMYAVHHEQDFCGVAGLTSLDPVNRRAEFSLYVAPGKQKKGVGKWALATLLSHGFENLGLHLIWGESFDTNPAMRLFLRLGFSLEGMRRDFYFRKGKFTDAHLFSITEKEWATQVQSLRSLTLLQPPQD